MNKTIKLLMLGMTRAGKTTKIAALSKDPSLISKVCIKSSATTPVTTDWVMSTTEDEVSLKSIELNPKVVYGSPYSRTVSKYNLALADNPFLSDVLGLQEIESGSPITDPKDYVEAQVASFVQNASFSTIETLMNDKRTGNCIKRLSIAVPVSDAFRAALAARQMESVILRDTRGIMDLNPADVEKMPNLSMYDLGLDGIDAVLLLCSSNVFPVQAGEWYKKVYGECFKSVPIFLEARHDALYSTYVTYSDLFSIDICDYLEQVYSGKIRAFDEMKDTHFVHGLDLLSTYQAAGKNYAGIWSFNYSVFNMDKCLFLTPTVASLSKHSTASQISNEVFDNDGYRFFQEVCIHNISEILKLVNEHMEVLNLIQNGNIDKTLYESMHAFFATKAVAMYPNYQTIRRADVCSDIVQTTDFLGPRNGITTQEHGRPLYLAAATSAATSHVIIAQFISTFKLTEKLKDSNGNELAPDMSIDVQNKLIRMYLNKKLRDSTDIYAYFRNYTITDRNIVVNTLQSSHHNNVYATGGDALTLIVDEIAKSIF